MEYFLMITQTIRAEWLLVLLDCGQLAFFAHVPRIQTESRFSRCSLESVQPSNESSSNYPHRHNQKWPSEVACPVTVMCNRLWNVWTWKIIRTLLALGERDRGHIPRQGFPVLWYVTSQVLARNRGCLLAFQKRWFKMWIEVWAAGTPEA